MYKLDDNLTKLLLEVKLCKNAAEMVLPRHFLLSIDELLNKMRATKEKIDCHLGFENKIWQSNKTFSEYFHKKLILGNKPNR